MTVAAALAWATAQLASSPAPAGDARLLLQHVLQVARSYLIAHADVVLTAEQETTFKTLVARARAEEPVPYLTGSVPFYGLTFAVTPDVLIPRPETELLVEAVLRRAERRPVRHVVDVGTGSGCIAVTLASRLPAATTISAIDISAAALAVARENATAHDVAARIDFYQGSLLAPLPAVPDLIVANLPYVGAREWTELAGGVKWYEPAVALFSGDDGLSLIGQLLQQAETGGLQSGGALFLEIGWRQGQAARALAQEHFPAARVTLLSDYAGHDRVLVVETHEDRTATGP